MNREYPERPLVGIAAIIFRGNTVLLVRRGREPLAGALSFPGGAQKLGETAEAAARRELGEETGLAAGPLRLSSHADVISFDDPTSSPRFHYTVLHFAGIAEAGDPTASSDVSEALFVPLADIEAMGLDSAHRSAVARAWSATTAAA